MTQEKREHRSPSRRKFIRDTAAVAASTTMFGATAQPAKPHETPRHFDRDLVLINGKIHTMDADNSVVSSVAIRDGRFVALGNGRGLPVQAGRETRVIDLRGRTVVPGIIDNHNHLVLMGNRPGYHTPLENANSIADVQQTYAARAKEIPVGAWITTIGGFHFNHIYAIPGNKASGRMPTLAELDVVPNPVFMMISFTGQGATNTAGRDLLTREGVSVGNDGSIAGGFPSSECTKALHFLRQTLLNPAERRRSAVDAMNYAASLGVTTHLDQGAFQAVNSPLDGAAHEDNFTMHIPFLELYDQGTRIVRLRINFLHMETDDATPELMQRLKNAFPFIGDEWVKTGGIGEFITQGTGPRFLEAARRVGKAGWRAEVHSLGRRASPTSNPPDYELEISAFEAVNKEFDGVVGKKRWVVAHVPGITQEWINRLKAIGGGLSLTGWQYLSGGFQTNALAPYAGPPFRMIVDSGINTGMSSDGMQIAPMNPWIHMYYATTGLNAKGESINNHPTVVSPLKDQRITRQEVLALYTSTNGWFLREENDLGSIEVGKRADLVVLNNDYFSVSNEDVRKIRSVLTVVGGHVVYDAGVLPG
jgi:predicted amidohydrolase YtcJ